MEDSEYFVAKRDVRYIDASSMFLIEFTGLQSIAERYDLLRFSSSPSCYSLLKKGRERELRPFFSASKSGFNSLIAATRW